MDDQENTVEKTPESPIQEKLTEEEPDSLHSTQDISGAVEDENEIKSEHQDNATHDIDDEDSLTLKVPGIDIRRLSTLQDLDKKNAWLSELEVKCMELETAFLSKIQYVAISNHYQKYLEELSSDDSMMKFRIELSNLFEKFRTAFTGSQQLLNKLEEIRGYREITNQENRKLKIELEGKNGEIEKLKESLSGMQRELLSLEREKYSLQRMFSEWQEEQKYDELRTEQETEKKSESNETEEAREKIDKLKEQLEFLNKELEFTKQRECLQRNKVQQTEEQKKAVETELNSVKYDLQKQTSRAEKAEASVLEKTEDSKNLNAIIKTMTEERKQTKMDLQRSKEEVKRLLKDQRQRQKDHDHNLQTIEKLRRDLGIREDRIKMVGNQKAALEIEINSKSAEVHALKGDITNVSKERNVLARKVALLEERLTDAEIGLENAKKEIAARQKELDWMTKEVADSESKAHELAKQKDVLSQQVLKHEEAITELQGEVKLEHEKSHQLGKELKEAKLLANGLRDTIKRLEKTKELLMKEIEEMKSSFAKMEGEMTLLKLRLSEMEKVEGKLRQQLDEEQIKFRRLAHDEKHSRKLLAELKHENEQLQNQQIVLQKQVEQLQGLNHGLDEQCKKLDTSVKSLTEQLGLAKELHKQEVKNFEELNVKLKRKDGHEQLLLQNEAKLESNIFNLERKIKSLLEEKNVQNSKLIEKESEIKELKENIRLLQQEVSVLDRAVNERIEDIKLLKFHIAEITRRNALMNKQVENIDDVREELTNAHNTLVEERFKSKALEEEVQKPLNLHRWRILEGIDPDRAQLVVKNQALQKQLIQRMKQLDEKEVELQEKIKQTQELQEQLRRRSQIDQEPLWACKKELSARIERVKCLTAENNMFQNICEKYRNEIMAMKEQLRKYKMEEMKSRSSKKRKGKM